nr:HNH/ENDO VII family nuclease [Marininema halotolerans]
MNLHHFTQREPGSMVELEASVHGKFYKPLHGLVEKGGSFRNSPILKPQYDYFRRQYWKWRYKQLNLK